MNPVKLVLKDYVKKYPPVDGFSVGGDNSASTYKWQTGGGDVELSIASDGLSHSFNFNSKPKEILFDIVSVGCRISNKDDLRELESIMLEVINA